MEHQTFRQISTFPKSLRYTKVKIYSSDYAFAAVRADGSVVTWGNACAGGDSSSVQERGCRQKQGLGFRVQVYIGSTRDSARRTQIPI